MHDIWNPWHGCARVSEGCDNCYMYYMDGQRGIDPSVISKSKWALPIPSNAAETAATKFAPASLSASA